jgi:hypothetical protein
VIACAVGVVVVGGCANPCLDDGLVQDEEQSNCAAVGSGAGTDSTGETVSGTVSASASASGSATVTASGSATGTPTASETGTGTESATGTDTDPTTETATDTEATSVTVTGTTMVETTTHCDDVDMDGFGDPNACTEVPEGDPPPPGTVDNDLDCDDSDPDTFPGAAQNEADSEACMNDDDDDGWGDDMPPGGVDVGIDCNDDGDSPCAVLVTQDGTEDDSYDQGLVSVLDGLGYAITNIADTDAVPSSGDGFDIIVLSESANSPDLAGTFVDTLTPVVCLEGLVWDDMQLSDEPATSTSDDVAIVDDMSPLAGGLSGDVDVLDGPGRGLFHTSPPAAARVVASVAGQAAQIAYFAFDEGDAMLGGTLAPARRVALGYDRDQQAPSNVTITDDGMTLFEAAVVWASN